MADMPIIFSAPMVRALLDGRKTMTRRLAWGKPFGVDGLDYLAAEDMRREGYKVSGVDDCESRVAWAPTSWQRVRVGDRLWVREGWRWNVDYHTPCYRVDYPEGDEPPVPDRFYRWRSPIHLARADSRLTLIVTATKIERLQNITPDNAWNEGVERRSRKVRQMWLFGQDAAEREAIYKRACVWEFEDLWNSLHGDGWDANPEVVAITFRVVRANIDAPEARAA